MGTVPAGSVGSLQGHPIPSQELFAISRSILEAELYPPQNFYVETLTLAPRKETGGRAFKEEMESQSNLPRVRIRKVNPDRDTEAVPACRGTAT